jgi:hypothetical protein
MNVAVSSINPNRTVPVQEDLRGFADDFAIIRGWGTMFRVAKELAPNVNFKAGEWAVLGNNQKLTRPTSSAVANTYLVFEGTDRFDVAASGQAGIIQNSKILVRTKKYNQALTYNVGDKLTVKDTGGGVAVVTTAAGVEPVLARVTAVPGAVGDALEYEVL